MLRLASSWLVAARPAAYAPVAMPAVEWTRLRWRMRGAWQWPAFPALTVIEAVLLNALPVWGDGVGGFVPGLLLAGSLTLVVVAVIAPLVGMIVRRRRRDLPM